MDSSKTNVSGNRKRHFNDGDDDEPNTKVLVEETSFSLESFSDEVLLEIFKNLDGNSLFAVGRTCVRFYLLISDHRLWNTIDLTSEPLSLQNIRQRLKSMHSQTESILLRGLTESYPLASWKNTTLSENLLKSISETCEDLQVLELHHSFIDFDKISITDFPKNIKRLVFNTCYARLPESQKYKHINTHFQCLEELSLEFCNWFETHDLVLFSKIPTLKKLSLRGCDNLKECVPYGSIAARFGFKKLEHFDVRETPISDSDIQCFSFTQSLKELLMECPLDLRDPTEKPPANQAEEQAENQSKQKPSFEEAQEPPYYRPESPRYSRTPNFEPEDHLIHIVVNDYNYINIQPTARNNNEVLPQVHHINAEWQQDPSAPALSRAISRSLWFERRYPPTFSPPRIHPISDRGICGFGSPRHQVQAGMVWIRAENRPVDHHLERLIVRHYKLVTDVSLRHLSQCSPNLIYLDLTGTSVSKEGVEKFKNENPACVVIADHLTN